MNSLLALCAAFLAGSSSHEGTQGNADETHWAEERARMVERQIAARGITDSAVLDAIRAVPRHRFVPVDQRTESYEDYPLAIGDGQTISQPFIVAFMTEALHLAPSDTVLEIGTGSGYQAAVLAEIVSHVYTIEIVEALASRAEATLSELGYRDIAVRSGDGYRGWPDHAPFNAIILTAAPDHIPQPLVDQLAIGGRMILPLGGNHEQALVLLIRTPGGIVRQDRLGVRFVPMTGEAEGKD